MRISRRLFVGSLGAGIAGSAVAKGRKPNVVVIMTDDQGAADVNCYGAKDLVTPNMDRIAKAGVRFTRFYSACPVCSPSRAGLLSGRFPAEVGVPGNIGADKEGLPSKHYLLPEMMKDAGYKTAHFGKWHLGHHEDTLPNGQGFDYSYGHMQGCIDNYSHFFFWSGPNRHDLWRNGKEIHEPGQFFPRRITEEATTWIEENRNDPFFIYFAMNTPHYPYQGSEKWLNHYSTLEYPRNLYAAFISTMDEYIGQLLDKLEELGLKENTIIIFQSDNGYSAEERAHFGGGSSGIYSGHKGSVLEGGIRVPGMISWPGHLPQNEVRTQSVHSVDWYATVAELCALPCPDGLDGRSIVPILDSPKAKLPDRPLHWSLGNGNQWAIGEGRWKLCGDPKTRDKGKYLFDIEADPAEQINLISDQPEIAERLERLHDAWMTKWNPDQKKKTKKQD